MNHIVSGCKDCPMCEKDNVTMYYCNHPLGASFIDYDLKEIAITPIDCPLKKENLTIVFDDKD